MSVKPVALAAYNKVHQFEPLLPQRRLDELVLRTRDIVEKSFQLRGAAHPTTRARLRELVRSMNSYYSNLIEGQSTHPRNIDSALHADFSDSPDVAQRQRIALAHIGAEKELEGVGVTESLALRGGFLQRAHSALYGRLSVEDRTTPQGRVVEPGQYRQEDVAVGRHQAPSWQSVTAFLQRADEVYGKPAGLDKILYVIAAAHHRMAWVHPFLDGNGRACRLQTHCALSDISEGLWSVNRGLARRRDRYYALMSNADMARQGDLDGRGNLSEKALWEWCSFFIELCEDQVSFMAKMLDLNELKQRIAGLVHVRAHSAQYAGYRAEMILPLHHVLAAGPVSRGEFVQLTGLGERTARKMLSQLLKDGLLMSESMKKDVGIGLPVDSLNLLLPNLYPEAAAALVDGE